MNRKIRAFTVTSLRTYGRARARGRSARGLETDTILEFRIFSIVFFCYTFGNNGVISIQSILFSKQLKVSHTSVINDCIQYLFFHCIQRSQERKRQLFFLAIIWLHLL